MPWDMIYMDEDTWRYVQGEAIKRGHPYPKVRAEPQQDLFSPTRYLFMSGAPQAVIWEIIRERAKDTDGRIR